MNVQELQNAIASARKEKQKLANKVVAARTRYELADQRYREYTEQIYTPLIEQLEQLNE